MSTRGDNASDSFRALAIFSTMRTNLALVDSFVRKSSIELLNDQNLSDLGFLGLGPGEEQRQVHNSAVQTLMAALLYQAFQNYCDMKRFKAELEDPDIEGFLDGLGDRQQFIEGMRIIRNHTFHIYRSSRKDRKSIAAFGEACEQRGGAISVMSQLLDLLYRFTERCFMGELRIFPDQLYEDLERRKSEDPQFAERWEKGELTSKDILGPAWGEGTV